jgi:hypothetical protein
MWRLYHPGESHDFGESLDFLSGFWDTIFEVFKGIADGESVTSLNPKSAKIVDCGRKDMSMKKIVLLMAALLVATALLAAVPVKTAGANGGESSLDGAPSSLAKCMILYHGKLIKCSKFFKSPNISGEPTMEKISYHYVIIGGKPGQTCSVVSGSGNFVYFGCHRYFYGVAVWRTPVGCHFRYQY